MTSPPIPPNFSHRIWTIHRNDLIEQWGGQFPPSPPRGAATATQCKTLDSLNLFYFDNSTLKRIFKNKIHLETSQKNEYLKLL